MRLWPQAALAACLLSVCAAAGAATITYTETAVISGSLNGIGFSNSQITFTGTADTSTVTTLAGLFTAAIPTINGTIAGVGSFTLTGDSFFSSEPGDIAGVARGSTVILDTFNLALDPYTLTTAIGPLSGQARFSGAATPTSAGTLLIAGSDTSTFQAVVATTPEPSSMMLLGTGLFGLAGVVRRRLG